MVCPRGLPNRRGRHAVLQNSYSSRLGAPDGACQSPGRCHCSAPEVRISGNSQARALRARSSFPVSAPTPMIPVQRRMGWRLHGLQAVGRAKIRTQNAPSTKRSSFLTLRHCPQLDARRAPRLPRRSPGNRPAARSPAAVAQRAMSDGGPARLRAPHACDGRVAAVHGGLATLHDLVGVTAGAQHRHAIMSLSF